MAILNDLIAQIESPELRARIQAEVDRLNKQKKFGLVFEEHLPECTPLYDIPVKVGTLVAKKLGQVNDVFRVISIDGSTVTCVRKETDESAQFPIDELVPVALFGESIYPYLKPIDKVCCAPDMDLWHTLIEADNYHALQLLEYLYAGKVDCIYIDPPYNTGARDWKYNNDYVDNTDSYRHSKWLSFMQKRLSLAKKLLSDDGAIIIAIDDNEFAHLDILLEEIFGGWKRNIISVQMNAKGTQGTAISVDNEYLIILYTDKTYIQRLPYTGDEKRSFRRVGSTSTRYEGATCFYPIIIDKDQRKIIGFGDVLPNELHPSAQVEKNADGTYSVWPIDSSGVERKWRYARATVENEIGRMSVRNDSKGIEIMLSRDSMPVRTMWYDVKYNSQSHGSDLIASIIGKDKFTYPKSLYAVRDALYPFVKSKPNALIVDFFAGSGTTLHAVNLLNAEDDGNRRCILVTNNEVSAVEAKTLADKGYHPGDEEWEQLGIARHVTWARTVCSVEGHDIKGSPLKGSYLGLDRPMSEGFKSNVAFFKLGFLDKNAVALGRQFKELVPVLWMKAGAIGECPTIEESNPAMLVLPKNRFAVLADEKRYMEFIEELDKHPEIETVYIVTDSETGYRDMISMLQDKTTYQLYRDYLDNFRINSVRR